jgi:hypothetical protein
MKFRLAILFVMVITAGIIGLYVSSCEVAHEEGPGPGRQTSGTLKKDSYDTPGSHYQDDAERGNIPSDVAPVEPPSASHEHEQEYHSPAPEVYHPEGHHHSD